MLLLDDDIPEPWYWNVSPVRRSASLPPVSAKSTCRLVAVFALQRVLISCPDSNFRRTASAPRAAAAVHPCGTQVLQPISCDAGRCKVRCPTLTLSVSLRPMRPASWRTIVPSFCCREPSVGVIVWPRRFSRRGSGCGQCGCTGWPDSRGPRDRECSDLEDMVVNKYGRDSQAPEACARRNSCSQRNLDINFMDCVE